MQLQVILSAAEAPMLIDVREPWEADICRIEGSTLIPLRTIPQRLAEIPPDAPVAIYCHAGMRSMMAAQFLHQAGYETLSLAGGIDRWAREVDPAMARY